ncbi:MAG: hypothetical protein LBS86_02540 [Treponema sp.]|jgi:ribosomal protein L32|nr:hypothetical protein [Treponema sp.]
MSDKSNTCFKKDGEPLSVYYSEDEAEQSSRYVQTHYDLDLVPYQCPRCGYWHLSPRDRQTPNRVCQYCLDSKGKPKQLYETEEAAEQRAAILEDEQGIVLKVYPCPHQHGWHLTKNGSSIY